MITAAIEPISYSDTDLILGQMPDMYLVRVTPAIAHKWLTFESINRKLKDKSVGRYAEMMSDGRWSKTVGDLIRWYKDPFLDIDAELIDGQHRLHAIVQSGASLNCYVKINCEREDFKVIDQGVARSVSDNLHAAGFAESKVVASAASLILMFHGLIASKTANKLGKTNFCEAHRDLEEIAKKTSAVRKVFAQSPFVAVMWMASQGHVVDRFINRVVTGEDLHEGDPEFALRKRAIERKKTLHGATGFNIVATAWNAYAKNSRIMQFRDSTVVDWIAGYPFKRGSDLP